MPNYIVRVELHKDATGNDYKALHIAMATIGFLRTIKGGNGKTYHLPPAEYYGPGEDYAKVRDLVVAVASVTKKLISVLVTEALAVSWQGLTEV